MHTYCTYIRICPQIDESVGRCFARQKFRKSALSSGWKIASIFPLVYFCCHYKKSKDESRNNVYRTRKYKCITDNFKMRVQAIGWKKEQYPNFLFFLYCMYMNKYIVIYIDVSRPCSICLMISYFFRRCE